MKVIIITRKKIFHDEHSESILYWTHFKIEKRKQYEFKELQKNSKLDIRNSTSMNTVGLS